LLLLISSGASATECQSSPGHDGKWWSYRIVDGRNCWYQGRPGRSKDLLRWAKQSPPPVVTRAEPGDSPPPAPPVPPQQPIEIVDTTPKVVSTVPIPALTSEAPHMATATLPLNSWGVWVAGIFGVLVAAAAIRQDYQRGRHERTRRWRR
jgi:hypothetical protein